MSNSEVLQFLEEILKNPIAKVFYDDHCTVSKNKEEEILTKNSISKIKEKVETKKITTISELCASLESIVSDTKIGYKDNEIVISAAERFKQIVSKALEKHADKAKWGKNIIELRNNLYNYLYNPPISQYSGSGINLNQSIVDQVINYNECKQMINANKIIDDSASHRELGIIINNMQPDLIEKGCTLTVDITTLKPTTFNVLKKKMSEIIEGQGKKYPERK